MKLCIDLCLFILVDCVQFSYFYYALTTAKGGA